MGNQESTIADSLLSEQLKTLASKQEPEESYVYIQEKRQGTYLPCNSTISINKTEQWEKGLMQDPKNRLALSALSSTDPKKILTQTSATIPDTQNFNVKISVEGAPITNQRSSGRCWLFAATNVFRVAFMKHYTLEEFELSQAYLFYWDKLEKANYFLEQILDTTAEDLEDREIHTLLQIPVGDGGTWDMAANLVEKYGLVPYQMYPDTYNAMNSQAMSSLITSRLREDARESRRLAGNTTDARSSLGHVKEKMIREIHLVLTLMLGPPPKPNDEMTWEYYNKDGKFGSLKTTPLKFASELSSKAAISANGGTDVHELFPLVNDPRNAYQTLLSVSRLGNVTGMRPVRYVNVPMDTIKAACIAMLQADLPIFFGCDVGEFSSAASGIMDTELIDYELGFNIKLGMRKAQRLITGESAMTHAMVLTAVHIIDGRSVRWRVQNSWGTKQGTDGWFVMSDRWMDEFVYQAVVDPRFVVKDIHEVLNQESKMLPLWDPMGALAGN